MSSILGSASAHIACFGCRTLCFHSPGFAVSVLLTWCALHIALALSFCAGQANILVLFLVFNACGDFGQWVLHAGPQNTARSDVFD